MKIIILFLFLLTISCSNNKVVRNHGLVALEIKANKIEVSKANKNDVLTIIGKPSTTSLFDDNIWFYIQREKVNQSVIKLGKSKINKNNVLEINFDNYGVVSQKKLYVLDNMNNLKIDKNVTNKKYDNQSSIGKLLKSLEQKVNAPKNSREN